MEINISLRSVIGLIENVSLIALFVLIVVDFSSKIGETLCYKISGLFCVVALCLLNIIKLVIQPQNPVTIFFIFLWMLCSISKARVLGMYVEKHRAKT